MLANRLNAFPYVGFFAENRTKTFASRRRRECRTIGIEKFNLPSYAGQRIDIAEKMKYYYRYETTIGNILLAENGGAITHLVFAGSDKIPTDAVEKETSLLKKAIREIREYLDGKRTEFDLPLDAAGTEFQKSVWKALQKIPYGKTCSYKRIAERVGNPKSCRAVGMANNRNPISLIVPCHRVIGSDGSMVGYGGGLEIKVRLLDLEKKVAESKKKT